MNRRRRPTLAQAIGAAFIALALALAVLLWLFYAGSRRTLLAASEQLMGQASRQVTEAVQNHLAEAERVVGGFEAKLAQRLVDADDPTSASLALLSELAGRPDVSGITLTRAQADGFYEAATEGHDAGDARLSPGERWQASVMRSAGGVSRAITTAHDGRWQQRTFAPGATAPLVSDASDPTDQFTFKSPASRAWRGRLLWSDLFLEGNARVVSVMKALWSPSGAVTVVRVSLLSERIDELVRVAMPAHGGDRHLVFICDDEGRLISRTEPADRVEARAGEVRVVPAKLSPPLAAALQSPLLGELEAGQSAIARLVVGGRPYLFRAAAFPSGHSQDWLVGVLVPESYYLADLQASLRPVLVIAVILVALCLGGAALVLRASRRDLGALINETTRLGRFDFAPAALTPTFDDVARAADSLEQAKTALRALGKYVPLDLVRQLYESRREPTLGGRVQDLSMVFSDIEGFTTVSENLPLEVLATALGRYLEAMTRAVHATHGIIDKYTGDGIMALWNAPATCADHPLRACEAVLGCLEATRRLFASADWAGLSPWRTRFGIHRAEVSVGHFGAPDRMSYTAMGDGVNLAARLEGLNKQYGTYILVSAAVADEARAAFAFRRLDRVAVKGKQQGVEVFELLGRKSPRPAAIDRYEAALDHYFHRQFEAALAVLGDGGDDGPSRVLVARCHRLLAEPPPPDWNGVYVAPEK
jgi:adenylate cyclase